jgi:hypothetical protein
MQQATLRQQQMEESVQARHEMQARRKERHKQM